MTSIDECGEGFLLKDGERHHTLISNETSANLEAKKKGTYIFLIGQKKQNLKSNASKAKPKLLKPRPQM